MPVKKEISYNKAKMTMNLDHVMVELKQRHQTERLTPDRWFLINHGYRCSYAEKGILKNAAKYLKQSPSGFIQVLDYTNRNFELLINYLEEDLRPFSKLNRDHITPFFFYPHPVLVHLNSVFDSSISYSVQEYYLDLNFVNVRYCPKTEKETIELSNDQIRLAPLKVQAFLAQKMRIYGYVYPTFVDELVWPKLGVNAA